ncbi:MAG: TonB-dependent receptor [Bacteroidales bacterium]
MSAVNNLKETLAEISISPGSQPLKKLIANLESETGYKFNYGNDLIEHVYVKVEDPNLPIEQLLSKVLKNTGITFVIKGKDVILSRNKKKEVSNQTAPKIIEGKVIDEATKEPVIGAQVWIKDTPNGTVTDVDGNFRLTDENGYGVLAVSYLGYQKQEQQIGKDTRNLLFKLNPDTQQIDEVVIVGYGTQKKESVVGSISSVKVTDLKAPVAKLSSNLGGQLSGVIALQRSGEPGAPTEFWIRGISTFGANKKPLVLVDGIERDLDLVDPEDIESFSVLKDAAATAIYGVRGANGVVLVKTRSGEDGKAQVAFKAEMGVLGPTKRPDMMNSVQFAELYNKATGSYFYSPEAIESYRNHSDPDLYPNVDWMNELYRDNALSERVNLSVSGGGQIAKYFISGGFYNEAGMFRNSSMNEYNSSVNFKRFNFRSNVDVNLHRTTVLNINLATVFERKNGPAEKADEIWKYTFITSPNAFPLKYSDGKFAGPPTANGRNPYNLLMHSGYREDFWNNAQSLIGLTQDFSELITPGLSANIKVSFDAQNYNYTRRWKEVPQYLAVSRTPDGEMIYNNTIVGSENLDYKYDATGNTIIYIEGAINYKRTFGKHDVSGLFLYNQKQLNKTGQTNSDNALPYRHQGIAGRVTYAYDTRYFIEGNFGYNGSENFSPGKRFGFFPSVAMGWLASNEEFFANLTPVIDMLKIKGSFGIVGNDQIGGGRRFIYNSTINTSTGNHFGDSHHYESGLIMGEWANPNVGWEKAYKTNAGIEISLYNALKIQADYFYEYRDGIFLERLSLPPYVGVTQKPWVNVGRMKNQGVDASLEYNQRIGEVRLSGKANFTYAHNILLDNDQPDWKNKYRNTKGQSLWQQFGFVDAGLFESQEDIDSWPEQRLGLVRVGDIKYVDLNGDGIIDSEDQKPIGHTAIPEILYGMGLSAAWKGFDVSCFFQGTGIVTIQKTGSAIHPFSARNMAESGMNEDIYYNHWSEENPNPNAAYPRLSIGENKNNFTNSTFWLENGRYIRLKNVEIGYTLPKAVAKKIYLSNARIYASGVNLLTFSPFKLWDPEMGHGHGAGYPPNRIFSLGVNLSF